LLASCYRTALSLAETHHLSSIAFPAISTGVYRFPLDRAAGIAVGTVVAELSGGASAGIQRVVFCCFNQDAATHYRDAFAELGST
jgi:O-acetyl-ADP-ribose deacetylase (regulator of RNase III)